MRQTHDLWHVLTGFDTSIPGEIGLQAFQAAQTRAPLSPILMGGALLRAGTDRTEMMEPLMEQITKGWQCGIKARSLFSLDWEANWSTPLTQLRKDYQIEI
jgi:ubiquinone biosynthesis protein Coq4